MRRYLCPHESSNVQTHFLCNSIACPGSFTGPTLCCVRPVSLHPSLGSALANSNLNIYIAMWRRSVPRNCCTIIYVGIPVLAAMLTVRMAQTLHSRAVRLIHHVDVFQRDFQGYSLSRYMHKHHCASFRGAVSSSLSQHGSSSDG